MQIVKRFIIALLFIIWKFYCSFHILFFLFSKKKKIIEADIKVWSKQFKLTRSKINNLIFLLIKKEAFRNLFYYRIGNHSKMVQILLPKCNTLFITTNKIGPGLFIQHGFSTIIAAKSLGQNVWVNQQVTIGYTNDNDCPVISDNVVISAGAKVIGKITLGKNVVVGANAVVVKDVPDNCTVVGIPAYIIKKNGIRVNEKL